MKLRAIVAFLVLVSRASATSLTANMTVDNFFSAYISTSDAVQGTLIGSGANWQVTFNFSSL